MARLTFESLERREVLSANPLPEVSIAPETEVQAGVDAEVVAGFTEPIPDDVYYVAGAAEYNVTVWDDADIVHIACPEGGEAAPTGPENCLQGKLVPKLGVEHAGTYDAAQAAYLQYALKDAMISSYGVKASGNDEAAAIAVGKNFEEVKLTYAAPIGSTAVFSAYLDIAFDSSL
ncbi:hypothetical protein OAS39_01005 [Pirellulales bacterium]|nr:hypothetical protein [Pirellulales bacterium]